MRQVAGRKGEGGRGGYVTMRNAEKVDKIFAAIFPKSRIKF